MYSEIAKVTNRPIDGFHVKSGIYFIKKFKLGTIDDNSIYNNSSIHIVDDISQEFGKKIVHTTDTKPPPKPSACIVHLMSELFKYGCADPEQCPFYEHELYNQFYSCCSKGH